MHAGLQRHIYRVEVQLHHWPPSRPLDAAQGDAPAALAQPFQIAGDLLIEPRFVALLAAVAVVVIADVLVTSDDVGSLNAVGIDVIVWDRLCHRFVRSMTA